MKKFPLFLSVVLSSVMHAAPQLEVNPAFGTLSSSIPLPELPGRNDFEPHLALIYQPTANDLGQGFGSGWSLSTSSIQVDNELGIPHPYYSLNVDRKTKDTFYQISLDGQALRYVGLQNGGVEYTTETFDSRVQIIRYDQPFTVAIRDPSGVLENRTISSGFELRQADGLRRIYSGDSSVAESYTYLNSGTLPEVQRKYTSRWPLVLEIKPGGDAIEYHYVQDQGRSYLRDVSFASGRSHYVFHWQIQANGPVSFTAGFRQESRLAYTGVVACLDDVPHHTWLLRYEQRPEPLFQALGCERSTSEEPSFFSTLMSFFESSEPLSETQNLRLERVYRFGKTVGLPSDAAIAREPTLTFGYKAQNLAASVHEIKNLGPMNGLGLNKNAELFDANQDGLPDLVVYDKSSASNRVYLNQGDGQFAEGEAFKIRRGTQAVVPLLNEGTQTSRILLSDLNGDGWDDLIEIGSDTSWSVFLNRKSLDKIGYESAATKVKLDVNGSLIDLKLDKSFFSNGRGALADLNGDGRTDIVYPILGTDGKAQFQAYINTTTRGVDGVTFVSRTYKFPFATTNTALLTQPEYRLIDSNQDGLVDLVKIVALATGTKGLCVFENQGLAGMSGSFLFREDKPKAGVTCEDAYFVPIEGLTIDATLSETFNSMVLMDVNGDGITDFSRVNDKTQEFEFWSGLPGQKGFAARQTLSLGGDVKISKNKYDTLTLDINQDGLEEILVWNDMSKSLQIIDLNGEAGIALLNRMELETGLTQEVEYTSYAALRKKPIPLAQTLVQRVTRRSSLDDFQEFEYGHGAWDFQRSMFAGFDQTGIFSPATESEGRTADAASLVVHNFARGLHSVEQRRYLGSFPKFSETFDLPDRKLLRTEAQTYSLVTIHPQDTALTAHMKPRYFIQHDSQEISDPKTTRTSWIYDTASFRTKKQLLESNEVAGPRGLKLPPRLIETTFAYDADFGKLSERVVRSLGTDRIFEIYTARYHPVWAEPILETNQYFVMDEDREKLPAALADKVKPSQTHQLITRYDGGDGTGFGLVESIEDDEGLIESYSYGPASLFRVATQNAKGQIAHRCYSEHDCLVKGPRGTLASASRPVFTQTIQGFWSLSTLDGLERPVKVEGSLGEEQTLRYSSPSRGRPLQIESSLSDTRLGKTLQRSSFLHDAEDRLLIEAIDRGDGKAWVKTHQSYSRGGEIMAQANPYASGTTLDALEPELKANQPGVRFSYDSLGRLVQTLSPGAEEITSYTYPEWGRIESKRADGVTRTRQLIARDLQAPIGWIDEEDQLHSYARNEFGMLRSIQSPEDKIPRSLVYDTQGQLLASLLPGIQTRVLERDLRGRVAHTHRLSFEAKDYERIDHQFDELDRLTRVSQNDQTLTEYYYDRLQDDEAPGSLLGTRSYDPQRVMDTVDFFERDARDRILRQKTQYLNSSGQVVQSAEESWVYQADDQEVEAKFDNRLTLNFAYDATGLLQDVRHQFPGQESKTLLSKTRWSPSQQLEAADFSDASIKGTWGNDEVRLRNTDRTLCGASCEQTQSSFDGQGFLQTRNDGTYSYNKRGELTGFDSTARRDAWKMSAAGHQGNGLTSPRSPLLPRAPADAQLEIDGVGRVKAFGATRVVYDAEDRILQTTGPFGTASFGYHADGRRSFKKTVSPEGQEEITWNPSEFVQLGTDARVSVPLPGGMIAELDLNRSTVSYLLVDQVNTPESRFDAQGRLLESWKRSAYGQLYEHTGSASTAPTQASFGGHSEDRETGWIDMGQRVYIPALTRFMTPDPLYMGDPEACLGDRWRECELYTYVANNPINFEDPTGLVSKPAVSAAAAAAAKASRIAKATATPRITTRVHVTTGSKASIHVSVTVSASKGPHAAVTPSSSKVIVIGEGMADIKTAARNLRAQGINAKWYSAWSKHFEKSAFNMAKSKARNTRWLLAKMKEGYKIYDIGINPAFAVRREFYALERALLDKHNYPTTPLDRP